MSSVWKLNVVKACVEHSCTDRHLSPHFSPGRTPVQNWVPVGSRIRPVQLWCEVHTVHHVIRHQSKPNELRTVWTRYVVHFSSLTVFWGLYAFSLYFLSGRNVRNLQRGGSQARNQLDIFFYRNDDNHLSRATLVKS